MITCVWSSGDASQQKRQSIVYALRKIVCLLVTVAPAGLSGKDSLCKAHAKYKSTVNARNKYAYSPMNLRMLMPVDC